MRKMLLAMSLAVLATLMSSPAIALSSNTVGTIHVEGVGEVPCVKAAVEKKVAAESGLDKWVELQGDQVKRALDLWNKMPGAGVPQGISRAYVTGDDDIAFLVIGATLKGQACVIGHVPITPADLRTILGIDL